MNIIETILSEKNKVLYEKGIDIQHLSEELIEETHRLKDEFQKKIALANIYYLRTIYSIDFNDAIKACEAFEKIPFDYFTEEFIKNYVTCLKLSYQFKKTIKILLELLNIPQSFELKYFCLRELVDDSMVADGAMTKEEYYEYKDKLKELLITECNAVEKIIP